MSLQPTAPIDVLLCGDRRYIQHIGVAVCSLLANNPGHRFRITIVTDRDIPDQLAMVEAVAARFGNATLRFPVFDLKLLEKYPVQHHFTAFAFVRLFAPDLFDAAVDRVLYLDGDLVVCRDIAQLWQTDLGNAPIAAVPDVYIDLNDCDRTPAVPRTYVNSGVMLMNLRQWRAEGATQALMGYLADNLSSIDYADQDALNAVFAGRIRYLPYDWNVQSDFAQINAEELGMNRLEFRKLRDNPGIVHYAARWKPWHYRHETSYRHLYWHYLAMTPWHGFVPHDRTPYYIVMKAIRLKVLKRWLSWCYPGLFRLMRRMQGRVGR